MCKNYIFCLLLLCGCNPFGGSSVDSSFLSSTTGSGTSSTNSSGSCSAGTAALGDVLAGKTFSDGNGGLYTGTLTNQGAWTVTGAGSTFPGAGYYSGIASAPTAATICSGTTILGVSGSSTCPTAALTFTPFGGAAGATIALGTDIAKKVTIANGSGAGTASATLSITGANSTDFELVATSNCTLSSGKINVSLYAADTATILILKKSNLGLARTATLSIDSPSGNATQSITASAIATLPLSWYRADSLGLSDGAAVASWTDSMGSYSATQAVAASKPIYKSSYINGLPALLFGGAQSLTVPAMDLSASQQVQLFVVATQIATSAGMIYEFSDNYNNYSDSFLTYFDTSYGLGLGLKGDVGYSDGQTSSVTSGGVPHVYTFQFDKSLAAAEASQRKDSSNLAVVYNNNNNNTNNFGNRTAFIGSRNGASTYLNGSIHEILLYSTPLTGASLTNMECYLAIKYGITIGGC